MQTFINTEDKGGLVIPFHTLEKGASAPRPPGHESPTIVVLHYTACADLPRTMTDTRTATLITRALNAKAVDPAEAIEAVRAARSFLGDPGAKQVPDAIGQAAIAAASPREACAHYYVASIPRPLDSRSRDSAALALTLPPPQLVVPVVEFVKPTRQAHHVGALNLWTNTRSIGIEVCYPGPAPRKECKDEEHARAWFSARGWPVPPTWSKQVCLDGLSRWFAPLPDQVVAVVKSLVGDLCLSFPTIRWVCSHWTFAPKKRIDPDPPLSVRDVATAAGAICGRRLLTSAPPR
jgi:N-acetyl-anhydromuramyl-L-alanine amidase AmpD